MLGQSICGSPFPSPTDLPVGDVWHNFVSAQSPRLHIIFSDFECALCKGEGMGEWDGSPCALAHFHSVPIADFEFLGARDAIRSTRNDVPASRPICLFSASCVIAGKSIYGHFIQSLSPHGPVVPPTPLRELHPCQNDSRRCFRNFQRGVGRWHGGPAPSCL